jgi:hypothetical protein
VARLKSNDNSLGLLPLASDGVESRVGCSQSEVEVFEKLSDCGDEHRHLCFHDGDELSSFFGLRVPLRCDDDDVVCVCVFKTLFVLGLHALKLVTVLGDRLDSALTDRAVALPVHVLPATDVT